MTVRGAGIRLAGLVRPIGPASPRPPPDPGPRAEFLATTVYLTFGVVSVGLGIVMQRPIAALGLVPVIVAPFVPGTVTRTAVAIVVGGSIFRIALVGTGAQADQVETTQAALNVVLSGGNPYGAAISGTSTSAAYPYGPLALLAYVPGVWTEVIASIATMALLAREKALVGLAAYAAIPIIVRGTVMGTNDILPGVLIAGAVLAYRRPAIAGVLIAAAAGIKPYAFAWLPPLLGAGGLTLGVAALAASLVIWSPLVVWGPMAYLRSLSLAQAAQAAASDGRDLRVARVLVVPAALYTFARNRTLEGVALGGTIVFASVMLLGQWLSLTYLLAPLPIVLIALERIGRRRLAGRVSEPAHLADARRVDLPNR
jgi:hypothetical protein